ncbi:MAG TPA: dihydroxyacetone kinase subunit DhaL [Burkholderiaceae bacterium]|nr:dihydroxyacetone kinase subunit DhaL [Burkholderiaceae bacterium]
MNSSLIVDCLRAVHASVVANEADIESLDRAIGDGDHYLNVKRGCDVLVAMQPDLVSQPPSAALNAIGMKLLSTIGGASGPLIASFFIAMGKSLKDKDKPGRGDFAQAFAAGVEAIKQRGKADVGEKTMLDVLIPVSRLLTKLNEDGVALPEMCEQLNAEATRNMLATRDMIATKGRAYSLGERALGHIDPGCKSCEVAIAAVCAEVLKS